MARTKLVQRKVLWATASDDVTSRGNPKDYSFYMECGHTRGEFHNAATAGYYFLWMQAETGNAPPLTMGCRDCTAGKTLGYFDKLRLGRLPAIALETHPELQRLWEQVKALKNPYEEAEQ